MMELIECKDESKFHSVTNIDHKQEGEGLDLDEHGGSNSSSNSLIVSKATQQSNGAPIATFIHTNETVRAVWTKVFLPEPVHVSFKMSMIVC